MIRDLVCSGTSSPVCSWGISEVCRLRDQFLLGRGSHRSVAYRSSRSDETCRGCGSGSSAGETVKDRQGVMSANTARNVPSATILPMLHATRRGVYEGYARLWNAENKSSGWSIAAGDAAGVRSDVMKVEEAMLCGAMRCTAASSFQNTPNAA